MNKLLICVIGLWLIALTYVQFKTEPELSADANATIIAYVHGDSLRSGMDLVKTLTQDLKVNEEKTDNLPIH